MKVREAHGGAGDHSDIEVCSDTIITDATNCWNASILASNCVSHVSLKCKCFSSNFNEFY